jgi:hypothetical protein
MPARFSMANAIAELATLTYLSLLVLWGASTKSAD